MQCLVTGGSGFLGSYVADELTKKGFKVVIYDKKKSKWINKKQKFVNGDLNNRKKIEKIIKKSDYVFHFAGLADLNESLLNRLKQLNLIFLEQLISLKFVKNIM